MFTLLHSNIHLYVKFYVSCFHWWAMLSCTILHDIISVLPLRSTTPPKGVSSSLVGQIKHRIPHANSKCHVHCTKDNLQQPLLRSSMLELLVDGPLEGTNYFPCVSAPISTCRNQYLYLEANSVLPFYYIIYFV